MSNIIAKYNQRAEATQSLLCVGLDSQLDKIPARFQAEKHPQFAFNRWIIEQTHSYAAAYKPNIAFYEARGEAGWQDLRLTMDYLQGNHPNIFTICDAKRGDISSTNGGYVTGILDDLGFDAITLHPYTGREGMRNFLERNDKACIILCRTSNSGAGEFQDLVVNGKPLWQVVAEQVRNEWNTNGNCMLVVGATAPAELAQVRQLVGDMTLLIPGLGAQGGTLADVIPAGLNSQGKGLILNVSRAAIFANDPAAYCRSFVEELNQLRQDNLRLSK